MVVAICGSAGNTRRLHSLTRTTVTDSSALPDRAPWIVLKFGGTSVSTPARWATIRELAASRRAEGARVLLVVSALSGVTDALKALCGLPDAAARTAAAADIAARHRDLQRALGLDHLPALDALLAELTALATAAVEHDYVWQAAVQAMGELLSSTLGAAALSAQGLPTAWLDARSCLLATPLPNQNERTRRLSASVEAATDTALGTRLAQCG